MDIVFLCRVNVGHFAFFSRRQSDVDDVIDLI
jgi:hypothetical protein